MKLPMKRDLKINYLLILSIFVAAFTLQVKAQDIKVACVGNSITQGAGTITFPDQLDGMLGSGWDVKNFGLHSRTLLKNGDYPYWTTQEFTNALSFLPDVVIIKLGTNDSKPQNWAFKDEFYTDYLALVDTFAQLSSNPRILLAYPAKAFNHNWDINDSIIVNGIIPLIDSVAKVRSLETIDLHTYTVDKEKYFSDGIHPNSTGNNIFADFLLESLVDSNRFIVRDKNLVFGKSVSTESASNSTENNLTDGNFANEWRTNGLPASAIVDLGSLNKVDYFQVAFSTEMNKGYQYTIEGSENGTNWNMLADNSSRNDTVSAMSTDSIGATNVRFLRLTVTSFSNSTSDAIKIAEFKAYQWTGYEHAPVMSLKRVNKTTAGTYIKRDHPGDAVSYFGATTDLTTFSMINFSISKSKLIAFNSSGTAGNTNSFYTVTYYNGIKVMSDTSTFTFYQNAPTDVNIVEADVQTLAYPNPFSDVIYFAKTSDDIKDVIVKIYDITGQLITTLSGKDGQLSWNGKDMYSNEVPAGIYICSFESGKNAPVKKVIISKR